MTVSFYLVKFLKANLRCLPIDTTSIKHDNYIICEDVHINPHFAAMQRHIFICEYVHNCPCIFDKYIAV